ncbi:solute carrier family 2: facilitated glucose transporter member 8-like isoform X1 [Dinothrombium tinctorium]|uniref:Solute carrier family 2: facilitated glucose transporter member 8-like isoform X1 n=1 Tax=Dinothrombium tinctorium TaxID=1965070 RepID=A0A3S5WGW3_9ACAR|nr:solute carrier family 2: facilitated glucose transporter member 8-like isoform X1 [Dinothrombium tinctorium]
MSQDRSLLIEEVPKMAKYVLPTVAAWFGSLAMGATVGFSSPAIPSILLSHRHLKMSESVQGWFGSLMALGAAFGAIIAASIVDKWGRKLTLMLSAVIDLIGCLIEIYSMNLVILFTGRFITGISCGVLCLAAPLYIAETADPKWRGLLGSGFQLFVTIGVLLSYIIGSFVSWSWLALTCTVYPLIMLILLCFMPETPIFLIKNGHIREANDVLVFLFGSDSKLSNPNLYTVNADEKEAAQLSDFKKKEVFYPMILSLILMFFQQFSAINAVMFFSSQMMKDSNLMGVETSIIVLAAVGVWFTFISTILTDKAGRRILLMLSGALMCICMAVISIYYLLSNIKGNQFRVDFGWIVVVALCSFVASFAIGYGPLPWVLMSEYVPTKVKGIASGIAVCFNWLSAFIVTLVFKYLALLIGNDITYLIFALINGCGVVFVYSQVFETKGKSLQEIEIYFKNGAKSGSKSRQLDDLL